MTRPHTTPFLFLLVLALGSRVGRADEYEDRTKPGHCACAKGNATWEYLRSPLPRPEDPVRCGLLLSGGSCANEPRPAGTSAACWGSQKVECFWRRHAWSWHIRCSRCLAEDACDACDDLPGAQDPEARAVVAKRVAAESASMDPDIVVAISPHFYVVTNVQKLKLRNFRGGYGYADAHEVAHLYAQRAEQAYDDFVHGFGPEVVLPKPMAVYVVSRKRDANRVSERYFGDHETRMNYAFNYTARIADGFCGNGCVVSEEENRDDNGMHGFLRHQIGHILFSCWRITNGFEDHCPRWAWVGAAHFLEKLLPIHEDYATFCAGESRVGEGPRKRWPKRVRDMAAREMEPIETFFNKNSLSDLAYPDHLRAWSVMDLMLREDRGPWLRLLAKLRDGENEAPAFREVLGLSPEAFQERWVERVLGKRKSMAAEPPASGSAEAPPSPDLDRLTEPGDPTVLAGRIRGLDVVADPKTAAALLPDLASDSDLVRETTHLVLLKTTSPEVMAYLRTEGLGHARPLVRAGVARVLGALADRAARGRLEALLDDRGWLVRANAAWALSKIHDPDSRPVLERHLEDGNDKAWISIADACASFVGRSKEATRLLAGRLDDPAWQVRLTAVVALRKIGTEDGLDALVRRFQEEDGRLARELHATLAVIARDDLGPNPESWRWWWKHQKETYGGLPPDLPAMPTNPADERYGLPKDAPPDEPHYYGRRFFSRSVCYVLDTSASMKYTMNIVADQAKELGKIPTTGSRMEIATSALVDSLEHLDPRTRVRLVFFSTGVTLRRPDLFVASSGNVAAAVSDIHRIRPDGETNFHGALKAALGTYGAPSLGPDLAPSPDTVFFLTDGRPTRGEITSMPELLSWLEYVNRFAKVRLHVIALGELNVDIDSLRALAKAGGGEVIWVRER